jgi:anti-sigma factor RsiW
MKCPDDGTLQEYLDSELSEARMRCASAHLEACPNCRDRLGRLEASMGHVHAWLDALEPEDLPALSEAAPRIAARAGGARWRWAAVALAGALAATVAMFLANAPVPPTAHKEAAVQKPQAPLIDVRAVDPVRHRAGRVAKRVRRPKPLAGLDDFVAFDDADPMQMGMVVRVMLPVSDESEIPADLVIGEDGRARAIRFIQ